MISEDSHDVRADEPEAEAYEMDVYIQIATWKRNVVRKGNEKQGPTVARSQQKEFKVSAP
jgi:hypothetical protein